MTPEAERNRQVEEILERAIDLAPYERESFLDDACKGDQALRNRLEISWRLCREWVAF